MALRTSAMRFVLRTAQRPREMTLQQRRTASTRQQRVQQVKAKLLSRLNIDENEPIQLDIKVDPRVLGEYETYMNASVAPEVDKIMSTINELYQAKDYQRMASLFVRMVKAYNIFPDQATSLNVLLVAPQQELPQVLDIVVPLILHGHLSLTPLLFDRVIVSLSATSEYNSALQVWNMFNGAPTFEPLPGTVYAMLQVVIRLEDVANSQQMMTRLHSMRGSVPAGGWNLYLDFLFRSRCSLPIRQAWYDYAQNATLENSHLRYFFMAAEELQDPQFTESLIHYVKSKHAKTPPSLLLPVLRLYASVARVSDAEALVAEIVEAKQTKLIPFAYANLLGIYARVQAWDKATALWETIVSNTEAEINNATVAMGLKCFLLKRDYIACESLFSELDLVLWKQLRGFQASIMLSYLRILERPSVQAKVGQSVITGRLPTFLAKLASRYESLIRRSDGVHLMASKSLSQALANVAKELGPHPAWVKMMSLLLSDPFPNVSHSFFNGLLPVLREFGVLSQAEVVLLRETLHICDPRDVVTNRLRLERNVALKFSAVWASIIEPRLNTIDYVAARELLQRKYQVDEEELLNSVKDLSDEDVADDAAAPDTAADTK
eukprot:TRINITY_DN5234_c0_g1_i1.p1 TRINITY_DN5234_c0_g1~~TRINITY_DN5234_c0_g1_i1.p1  ORF type:complete len:607 (-),score=121.48 TRINITY_DN5234_c0_g1_i1:11-1831(-)